jgi:hypothetical protein
MMTHQPMGDVGEIARPKQPDGLATDYRPISFVLFGESQIFFSGTTDHHTVNIITKSSQTI